MENWGLKHPRKKKIVAFLILDLGWVGDDWGGIAAAWRMYSASIWTHFLRMKSWKNPSTFCHWNMVQTSSNSGAPRSQFWFKVFLGERSDCKILAWGALDGLWAVGGQSRTSSWKKIVCVGIVFRRSFLRVESSISKLYWFWNICIFSDGVQLWEFPFQISFFENFNFWEFPPQISNFVRVSMSES